MSLSVWQRNIVTESGDVIPDAEIEVFDAGSSSKPDLFSDPDGNSSITNPFNADSNGFARFYVAGGRYDIAVNGAVLWEDVALGTTQRRDTGPAPSEVPTNAEFGGPTPAEIGRGAIVESGSNSNGHYVRWENGEQVCWFSENFGDIDITSSSGNIFITESSDILDWTFPANFIQPPVGSVNRAVGRRRWASVAGTTDSSLSILGFSSVSDTDVTIGNLIAWGFWK